MIPICSYLSTPFFWTIGIYTDATFKFQPSPDLGVEEGEEIKAELQPFINSLKLNKDIKIRAVENDHGAAAYGLNLFQGDALVKIHPGYFKEDKLACLMVVKHEIGHIINNDPLRRKLVGVIYSLSLAIFSIYLLPFHPIMSLIIPATTLLVSLLYNRLCEQAADDFAIANSTSEELEGYKRFFERFKNPNKFSLTHPTITSRLEKVKNAIIQRKAVEVVV